MYQSSNNVQCVFPFSKTFYFYKRVHQVHSMLHFSRISYKISINIKYTAKHIDLLRLVCPNVRPHVMTYIEQNK